jgi:hypothetical protein
MLQLSLFHARSANSNIMRPTSFDPSVLRQHLRRNKIADLPELKRVLGTDTDLSVFRKLKQLHYLPSYTHRGRFYTPARNRSLRRSRTVVACRCLVLPYSGEHADRPKKTDLSFPPS